MMSGEDRFKLVLFVAGLACAFGSPVVGDFLSPFGSIVVYGGVTVAGLVSLFGLILIVGLWKGWIFDIGRGRGLF